MAGFFICILARIFQEEAIRSTGIFISLIITLSILKKSIFLFLQVLRSLVPFLRAPPRSP
jgi:hypothetical protein